MSYTNGLEIAVIGMACRFPGAKNIDEYWNNLVNGTESISFFSNEELREAGVDPELLNNPNYVKAKGFIEDIEYFDASFFHYSSREAEIMDPQIRLLLECSWEAMEHAGYTPNKYEEDIGFYAGASSNFNWPPLASYFTANLSSEGFEAGTLAYKDAIGTLISYKLNLKGPSFAMYSACSTSLASIHQACRGLLLGECSMALAGGVCVSFPKKNGYLYQEGMIESPDGHCRSFDAKAEGSVFGDGAGIVVLKSLENALADGDTIHAVIKATAMNNDGSRKVGYTAPSVEGQAEVIRKALHLAEIETESISYIEAHGSGTSMGDPIEIKALEKAFELDGKRICAVGSVKSNVGHLDTASGVAGFIKTVLSLKNKKLPPSLHFETPNPEIDFENSPFYVNHKLTEWKNGKYPLRAGVSSFGLGGTNVHVILEEAPAAGERSHGRTDKLLVLSAKSSEALDQAADNLAFCLERNPEIDLGDAAYTLQVGRDVFPYRAAIVCENREEAVANLKLLRESTSFRYHSKENKKQVVFMFSGQSSQCVNMGLELYRSEPVFREAMDECFEIFHSLTGYSLKDTLYPKKNMDKAKENINRTEIAQPVLFVFEYALAKLLINWGIRPSAVIGYSFGEYAAACLGGVFSLRDACSLVIHRGKLMQSLPKGAMLSVPLPEQELRPFLEEGISIAVVNHPACIVSGSEEAIERFEDKMKQQKLLCMRLNSNHAGHSAMMESVVDVFERGLQTTHLHKPTVPYISGMTGKEADDRELSHYRYWVRHLVEPVRFSEGIADLSNQGDYVFIEIGPGRDLSTIARRYIEDKSSHIVNLVQPQTRKMSDNRYLLKQLGKLWLFGVGINWNTYHAGEIRQRIPLPTYPFEKKYYWPDVHQIKRAREKTWMEDGKRKSLSPSDWFYLPLWKQSISPQNKHGQAETGTCYLLFMDEYGIGTALSELIRADGSEVLHVRLGSAFEKREDKEYIINPHSESDYLLLMKSIRETGRAIHKIIHLCSLNREREALQRLTDSQTRGYYSVLHLVKAALNVFMAEKLQIHVIANNIHEVIGTEQLYPEHSTILGPCKVIPQEYTNISCRIIDIEMAELPDPKLIDQLKEEFHNLGPEPVVCLRGGKRWLKYYEQVRLDKTVETASKLKQNGVYVITGGTGGIGLELAAHLAKTRTAKLALIHRSFFPEREDWENWLSTHKHEEPTSVKIRKLMEIERFAGGLVLEQADVSDMKQMGLAVKRIEEKFERINGVIHAAGTLSNDAFHSVTETGKQQSEQQFRTKLYGTVVLENMFKEKDLDFCLLMSSISSVLGGLGHTAYCAANTFLDAYAVNQNRNPGACWLSINWDGWIVTKNEDGVWGEIWEETAMTPAEGVEAFEKVLTLASVGHAVNSTAALQSRIDAWSMPEESKRLDMTKKSATQVVRSDLSTTYIAPQNETQQSIIDIFQKILGISGIGIQDDFLEMGGDSLKAITVLSTIRQQFNTDIPLKDFFNNLTGESIAALIMEKSLSSKTHTMELAPVDKKPQYPVSSAQKRMYLLDQINPDSTLYNTTILKNVNHTVNKELLEQVFRTLIDRHESLRTAFLVIDDVPHQRIHESVSFSVQEWNMSGRPDSIQEVVRGFVKPFNLEKAPLLRVGLIHTGEQKNIVVIDIHHIITDLLSMDLLQRDFHTLLNGKKLNPLPLQYKDYAVWINSEEYKNRLQPHKSYWLSKFSDKSPLLNLPTDFPRGKVKTYEGSVLTFECGEEETGLLRQMAREQNATLFMILLTAFNVMLFRLTGQTDIVVGVPTAGRNYKDLENILGLFVNTLPIRNGPSKEKTFHQLLNEIKTNTLEAFEHQEYPFEDMVEHIVVERDTGRNPVFDVMFNLLDRREDEGLDEDHITEKKYNLNSTSKFDLSLTVREAKNKLFFEFEYSTELFKESTIDKYKDYYQRILMSAMQNGKSAISDMKIVPKHELSLKYEKLNATNVTYPGHMTVYNLVDERARRHPEKIALWFEGKEMTYAELQEKSNQLAHSLRNSGISRGSIVGIMLEHSFEAVTAILAIMKTGAAYLPIDPEYPKERINFLLKDSRTQILLVSGRTSGKYNFNGQVLNVEDKHLYDAPPTALDLEVAPEDPVYIIYTSGSTGKPKGVVISHKSLMNHINWATRVYMKEEEEFSCPLYSSLSFDLTVTSLFAPLATGNKMVIYKGGNKEMVIQKILEDDLVHIIKLTPTHLKLIKELGIRSSNIRTFVVNGELMRTTLARDIYRLFDGNAVIYNEYGPTEATVGCTIHRYDFDKDDQISVPIGTPVDNAKIYLLDDSMQLVPEGIPGEIYISGDGVALGYLYRNELTREKFLTDPFEPERMMYKTGDTARLLDDGKLEFLGRQDHQVKIRGFRIELGEITKALESFEPIKEGIVIARENGAVEQLDDKYLCAYFVTKQLPEKEPNLIQEIKEHLAKQLPSYLVPQYFMRLDEFPVTPNGKLDMNRLPVPNMQVGHHFTAAESDGEKVLAEIWAGILNRSIETLSIDSSFFEMGGHSLKAAIMASRIHKRLNIKVPMIEIFNRPTIRELAKYMKEVESEAYEPIPRVPEQVFYDLSSAQRKLYFLQQMNPNDTSYNLPMFWEMTGSFNRRQFEEAFQHLLMRHESLRTYFVLLNGETYQKLQHSAVLEIEYHDVSSERNPQVAAERIINEFVRPFDLTEVPLRVGLVELNTNSRILMVDIHHIITDGVSMGILAQDFMALFAGKSLPEIKVRYRDYAAWYKQLCAPDKMKKQEMYWQGIFDGELPVLNLPTDFQRPAVRSFEGDQIGFSIPEDITQKLKKLALEEDATLFIVLLAVYYILLSKLSGQDDIIVGTDTAGREHVDLHDVIGNFANTLALRNFPQEMLSFNEFLAEVRKRLLEAYENQDFQFEDLVDKVVVQRDLSRHPLFDVMFGFLSSDMEDLSMSGLTMRAYPYDKKTSIFDLVLQGYESNQDIVFQMEYSSTLFARNTVETFIRCFNEIIEQIIDNRHLKISDIRVTHRLRSANADKFNLLEGEFSF
ncbi:amino acid adenylation domain-containing protein [Paenibacillus larvae]|uniref:type I polyketide synthase n=1 Tax=Paenibacillus larvae TaxID=1464 RepID=UPI0039FBAE70